MNREKLKLDSKFIRTDKKLKNASFISKAPAEVIEKEKEKLQEYSRRLEKISKYLEGLN